MTESVNYNVFKHDRNMNIEYNGADKHTAAIWAHEVPLLARVAAPVVEALVAKHPTFIEFDTKHVLPTRESRGTSKPHGTIAWCSNVGVVPKDGHYHMRAHGNSGAGAGTAATATAASAERGSSSSSAARAACSHSSWRCESCGRRRGRWRHVERP